jgi:hypothetical protein
MLTLMLMINNDAGYCYDSKSYKYFFHPVSKPPSSPYFPPFKLKLA